MALPDKPDYLNLSEEDIDQVLADALMSGTLGSKDRSKEEKRTIAGNWFRTVKASIAKVICNDEGIARALVGPETKDRNTLIAMIGDALLKLYPVDYLIPINALACKIFYYGVDKLCKEEKAP